MAAVQLCSPSSEYHSCVAAAPKKMNDRESPNVVATTDMRARKDANFNPKIVITTQQRHAFSTKLRTFVVIQHVPTTFGTKYIGVFTILD